MNDEIYGLRADIEALRLECAELRAMVEQRQAGQDYDSDLLEAIMFRAPTPDEAPRAPSETPPRRPFDIWYDFKTKDWKIYLPDTCIMVGTAVAAYRGAAPDGVAQITPAGSLYCLVYAEKDGEYTYDIDPGGDDEDAMFTFPVASFSRDLTEVEAQFVSGLVLLERAKKKAYVVTGVSQTMDGDHGLVLHVTKAPVLVGEPSESESSASLSESSSSTTVATLAEFTAVTGSVYDPSSHVFYNKTRTVKVLADVDSDDSASESVFTAVPVCANK